MDALFSWLERRALMAFCLWPSMAWGGTPQQGSCYSLGVSAKHDMCSPFITCRSIEPAPCLTFLSQYLSAVAVLVPRDSLGGSSRCGVRERRRRDSSTASRNDRSPWDGRYTLGIVLHISVEVPPGPGARGGRWKSMTGTWVGVRVARGTCREAG